MSLSKFFLVSSKWPVPSTKSSLPSRGFCYHISTWNQNPWVLIHLYGGSAEDSRSQEEWHSSNQVEVYSSWPNPASFLHTRSVKLWPLWWVTGSFSCWTQDKKKSSSTSCYGNSPTPCMFCSSSYVALELGLSCLYWVYFLNWTHHNRGTWES